MSLGSLNIFYEWGSKDRKVVPSVELGVLSLKFALDSFCLSVYLRDALHLFHRVIVYVPQLLWAKWQFEARFNHSYFTDISPRHASRLFGSNDFNGFKNIMFLGVKIYCLTIVFLDYLTLICTRGTYFPILATILILLLLLWLYKLIVIYKN